MPAAAPPIIRPARSDDALCLGMLATQVFLDNYAPAGIRAAIANEALRSFSTGAIEAVLQKRDCFVLVAEVEQHLVAFAQVTVGTAQALVQTETPAELDRLYVQEPFTRIGLGSRLIAQAESQARAMGASAMWLTPWVHNHRALQFYAKHGYRDLGTTWFDLDGERHENRVLCKDL
jgi:GNAT superfamily N-acetyltransferase